MKEHAQIWRHSKCEGIELVRAHFKKFRFEKHWHDEFSLCVVTHGAEVYECRGHKNVISAGSIGVLNPGEIHDGAPASNEGWGYYGFRFSQELLDQLSEPFKIQFSGMAKECLNHDGLFQHLIQLYHSLEYYQVESLAWQSLLYESFYQLLRVSKEYPPLPPAKKPPKMEWVQEYLHDEWQTAISLDSLAELVELHPHHLLRSFKREFGLTPHKYLIQVRVQRAKQLLRQSFPVSDVAYTCGFFDQSHFHHAFKRTTGVTPGSFQRT